MSSNEETPKRIWILTLMVPTYSRKMVPLSLFQVNSFKSMKTFLMNSVMWGASSSGSVLICLLKPSFISARTWQRDKTDNNCVYTPVYCLKSKIQKRGLVWFGLAVFYGISTLLSYSMAIPLYIYIYIYIYIYLPPSGQVEYDARSVFSRVKQVWYSEFSFFL